MDNRRPFSDQETQQNSILQEPVAIIGIGCRYSGDIHHLDDFWQVLINKKSTLSDVPEDRFQDIDNLVDPERNPGKIVSKKGGWLDNLKAFDAKFFKISPREAEKVDPHQRLMLEVTFQALEDAGLKLEDVWGTKTGVFAGMWSSDFEHVLTKAGHDIDVYATTGSGRYGASGRIAYFYNLQGPTFTLDTACSTSLVAVHLASQSLQLRETDLVVCSAANLILDPFISVGYSRSRLLSDYGKCRFGAKDASGYVRTEGAATVILKRLADAERDGDKIYAVVPGTACNSDGQSHKYMLAPSAITQEIMIKDALKRANVSPSEVQYVECHGTGTKAGDPAEVASVSAALGGGRDKEDIFYAGSIKTNLGHTEAASGFAGMIKTVLAIQNRVIPGNLYADEEKNPNIPWDKLPMKIPFDATPWPHPERPLLAGVNSFGISGTNAHVLLREYKNSPSNRAQYSRQWKLFPVSGMNEKAVEDYVKNYRQIISDKKFSETELLNYTKNVAIRKADLAEKVVFIFQDTAELLSLFAKYLQKEEHPQIVKGYKDEKLKTALIFPGQGAQWNGMGQQLFKTEAVFRDEILKLEAAYSPFVSWKLSDELFSANGMATIDVIQPALVAIEIALAKWWQSNGLKVSGVIGHSMGEVGAAYISGAISVEDAAAIICHRSRLMKQTSGQGAMGYLAISPEETMQLIQGKEAMLSLGVNNSPQSSVISGSPDEVARIIAEMDQKGVFARKIKVDVASHSPQMQPLLAPLKAHLDALQPSENHIPFYSSVMAEQKSGETLDADYWCKNLRETVRFAATIQKMAADGIHSFVEVSPHPTLLQAVQENAQHENAAWPAIGSLEREKDEVFTMMQQYATAFCNGANIHWKQFYGTDYTRLVLPEYPWQRELHWIDDKKKNLRFGHLQRRDGSYGHPLLQQYFENPTNGEFYVWESDISLSDYLFLKDHLVHEAVVLPGAAFIEMLMAAAEEVAGSGLHLLQDLKLNEALPLNENESVRIQIVLRREVADTYFASISSLQGEGTEAEWKEHVSGEVVMNCKTDRVLPYSLLPEMAQRAVNEEISASSHYDRTTGIGLPYGAAFRTVEKIMHGENIFIGEIKNTLKSKAANSYFYHPALLDGCIQVFLAAIYDDEPRATFVPVSVKRILIHQYVENLSTCKVVIKIMEETTHSVMGNAVIYDSNDQILLEMKGFALSRLEQDGAKNLAAELLYETKWEAVEPVGNVEPKILLFAELGSPLLQMANVATVVPADAYHQNGHQFSVQPQSLDDYEQLWKNISSQGFSFDAIVFAWGLDEKDIKDGNATLIHEKTVLALSKIIRTIPESLRPSLTWLSRSTQSVTGKENIFTATAPLQGIIRVISNELSEYQPKVIDVDEHYSTSISVIKAIISDKSGNISWAIRDNKAYVAEIIHAAEKENKVANKAALIAAGNLAFEAVTDEPGLLDNIVLREKTLPALSPTEVCIEVKSLGINFMNLMSALGIYPGKEKGFATLGIECAGEVKAIGSSVTHLQVGDRVMGMAYHTMASHIVAEGSLMQKIPAHLSYEEAATIPVVFLTVYYSLVTLGRLQPGEKVLIHSATGGVGLAALQVAQYIGAEIYATAGNDEKRQWLKDQGIEHVYSSRTTDFADRIMEATGGAGVDVVLNSLTGDLMLHSLELLGSFGRFVEIGKKDVYANSRIGLEVFSRGLSYFMVDFEKMIFEKPAYVGQLLGEIIPYFEKKIYQPLTYKAFDIKDARQAFEYMSKGIHTGKVVVNISRENTFIEQRTGADSIILPQATYLITGGYGGLGLTFAQWLVQNGARHLVLTGRKGPGDDALETIQQLEQTGAKIEVVQADVSNFDSLKNVIEAIPESVPLKGVFHLAGILDDAAFNNLTPEQYQRVTAPKINGALYLHQLTAHLPLDYFVLFSSSTILFGSPGQTAYVAANAYMDALAQYRQRKGLAALSVQWGTVAEIGLAAAAGNRANRLRDEGVAPLMAKECTEIFEEIIQRKDTVIGAFRLDIQKWEHSYPAAKNDAFFKALREDNVQNAVENAIPEESWIQIWLQTADKDAKILMAEDKLREKVSQVVKLPAEQISNKTPFKSLGIDSLMSIQLKNQLEKTFDTTLSVTSFWTYANIRDYTLFLLGKLSPESTATPEPVKAPEPIVSAVPPVSDITLDDDVSLDDLSKLLEDELNDL